MVGPVFALELLLGSRRSRLHAFRRLLTAGLLLQFLTLLLAHFHLPTEQQAANLAPFVQTTFQLLLAETFLLLALAVPAYLAGTITDDKSNGTLALLLTADLTPFQIITGKMLGRLAPVALLGVVAWPLLAFVAGYGAVGAVVLLGLLLLSVVLVFALAAFSIWSSVRSQQTREAVLRVYCWWAVGILLVGVLPNWGIPQLMGALPAQSPYQAPLQALAVLLPNLNPLAVLEAAWGWFDPEAFVVGLASCLAVYGGLGVLFLALATWQLRTAVQRSLEGPIRRERVGPRRAAVSDDPVYWKEKLTPRWGMRWLTVAGALALATVSMYAVVHEQLTGWYVTQGTPVAQVVNTRTVVLLYGATAAALFSFLAGIRGSGSVSGERERQTWESLLLTPLDSWDLLVDKHQGIMARLRPYLLAYSVPTAVLALALGPIGFCFALASIALTWSATNFMAATGIQCSVTARNSWRALLATLAIGYGYWFVLSSLFAFFYFALGISLVPFFLFFLNLLGVQNIGDALVVAAILTTWGGLAWLLWWSAQRRIAAARIWVDQYERYGRTLVRSLTRALRKYSQSMEARKRQMNDITRRTEIAVQK